MRISDNDIKFVLWAGVASLLLMALLHLTAPRAPSGEVYNVEDQPISEEVAKSTFTRLEMLKPDALRKLLAPKNATPTFVLIYTSWCPHCRQTLPDMLNLKDKGFFKHARTLFISIDEEPDKLARYLSQPAYKDAFTPYILDPAYAREGMEIFDSYHFKFRGAIPYAILMDGEGNVIADTSDDWDTMLQAIKELK